LPADRPRYAFIVLLRDQGDALALARLLADLRADPRDDRAEFLVPPVRGLRFFADDTAQRELDAWWACSVPDPHLPVYLVDHEPGLPEWLPGIDGRFYVGLAAPDAAGLYPAGTTLGSSHPLDYARLVMRDHCAAPAMLFAAHEAARLAAVVADLPGFDRPEVATTALASGADVPGLGSGRVDGDTAGSSLRFLDQAGASARAPAWRASLTRLTARSIGAGLPRRGRAPSDARELAHDMVHRGSTIVVMGSRKGGVGKTSFAAGVAIQAGRALDAVGHTACLLDANLANPDAWGQMSLPARAATVRQVVAALNSDREPPPPIHAQTPALACYPESREASDYSMTDVDRLASYLRRRYTFIVVDMSNRLPDPLGGPEAAAAAYWLDHADVIVLPTTSSKQDFNGVLDYLDVAGLPPVVVPYIVPRVRLNREHRVTRAYLEAIRARVNGLVEIPDQADEVRRAGMENLPVEQVSPALRRAYRRLTEAVVAAPPRAAAARS